MELIVIVALLALLWLFLIRPARRRQTAQQELISGVQIDDEIITAGGLYGYVRGVDEDELLVEVAPDVRLRVARRAVAAVIPQEEEAEEEALVDNDVEDESDEGSQSANPNDVNRG